MKVGILDLYAHPTKRFITGMATARDTVAAELGWETIAFGPRREGSQRLNHYITHFDQLNDMGYDCLVLSSPGSIDMTLEAQVHFRDVRVPFFIQSHNESDEIKLATMWPAYFKHPKFRGFLPIMPKLWRRMPDVPTHTHHCGPSWLRDLDSGRHEKKFVASGRITPMKRTAEFLAFAQRIERLGWASEVWGAIGQQSYYDDLMKNGMADLYKGRYKDAGDFRRASYVWAGSYWDRHWAPRVELVVCEALEYGIVPLYMQTAVPEIFKGCVPTFRSFDVVGKTLVNKFEEDWSAPKLRRLYNESNDGKNIELLRFMERYI